MEGWSYGVVYFGLGGVGMVETAVVKVGVVVSAWWKIAWTSVCDGMAEMW